MFSKRFKIILSSALCICASLSLPLFASASEGNIELTAANFPDANFRAYIGEKFDLNQDGGLSESERNSVQLIVVEKQNISSLKGIEYFPNLYDLSCSKNQLTELDVSKNTALTHLGVHDNQLTTLDVSKNTALEMLICSSNLLTGLDISQNTALEALNCSSNRLTKLDVSKNTDLLHLYCDTNQLTSIDVSKNTKLTRFECYENQLTSIDVTKQPDLQIFYCDNNQIRALDVSKNTKLRDLQCQGNLLTELDVTHNPKLILLYCHENQLSSLDVSKNTKLDWFDCSDNRLTSLNIFSNTALTELTCSGNQLKTLDVSRNTRLLSLICDNNQIKVLDVSMLSELEQLWCDQNQLTELNVARNAKLDDLMCSFNHLTKLDVSKNSLLSRLCCDQNQLTELDVTKNPKLTWLYCDNNQLTSLDISKNPMIYDFCCSNNQLAWLDMSANQRDDLETDYLSLNPQNIQMTAPLNSGTWAINLSALMPQAWLQKVIVENGVYHSDIGLWMIPADSKNQFTYSIPSGLEKAGALNVTLHLSSQEIDVQLPPKNELMQALLTEEEIQQVNSGAELTVWTQAEPLQSKDVKIEERHQIERAAGEGVIAQYLDLNLFKQIGNNTSKITETNRPIAITLPIPSEYLTDASRYSRSFGVIRVHNGRAEKLESTYDPSSGKITFLTDGFSTYALYYVDAANVQLPHTGDSASLFGFVLMLILSTSALLIENLRRRNRCR